MAAIKEIAVGGKEIDDTELVAIAESVLWKREAKKHIVFLDDIGIFIGRSITSITIVNITLGGERKVRSRWASTRWTRY